MVNFFAPTDFLTMTSQMLPGACERFNESHRVTHCHDDLQAFEVRAGRRREEQIRRMARRMADQAAERAARPAAEQRPFFTFVLLDAPHQPYDAPGGPFQPAAEELDYVELVHSASPELVERMFNRYRNAVHWADGAAADSHRSPVVLLPRSAVVLVLAAFKNPRERIRRRYPIC